MEGDERDIFKRANETYEECDARVATREDVQARFEREIREEAGPVVCEIWNRMDAVNAEHGRQLRALFMELHAAKYAGENHEHVLAYGLHPFRLATGGWEVVNGDDVFLLPSEQIAAHEDTDDYQAQRFYSRAAMRILQAMSQLEADGTDTEPQNPDWTYQS